MTPREHCPCCTGPARMAVRFEQGEETVTGWSCGCGHRWQTRYLTAAYEADDYDWPDS